MRKLCFLLAIAVGPSLIALLYALLVQDHTVAYNSYVNEYRKWPWRAGAAGAWPGKRDRREVRE